MIQALVTLSPLHLKAALGNTFVLLDTVGILWGWLVHIFCLNHGTAHKRKTPAPGETLSCESCLFRCASSFLLKKRNQEMHVVRTEEVIKQGW